MQKCVCFLQQRDRESERESCIRIYKHIAGQEKQPGSSVERSESGSEKERTIERIVEKHREGERERMGEF